MLDERRISELSDKELEDYYNNAVRLAQSGTPAQREEAERLLPILGEAIQVRSMQELLRAKEKASAKAGGRQSAGAARKPRSLKAQDQDGPTEH